jgi:hypothetical protein
MSNNPEETVRAVGTVGTVTAVGVENAQTDSFS